MGRFHCYANWNRVVVLGNGVHKINKIEYCILDAFNTSAATEDAVCVLEERGVFSYWSISADGSLCDRRYWRDADFRQVSSTVSDIYLLSNSLHVIKINKDETIKYDDLWLDEVHPEKIDVPFKKISCGAKFITALSTGGDVYAYGKFFDGDNYLNRLTKIHSGIVDIACGDFHCILLQENGKVMHYGEKGSWQFQEDEISHIYASGKMSLLCRDGKKPIPKGVEK